ncbi:MAG TPA: hypothetical protein VN976_02550 [Verrucomicrobiae bacterium]|nr:hypothetical protein [Verrucomicrobiae bacterium]
MLLKASDAVTVKKNCSPAEAAVGPVTEKWVAAPGLTVIEVELPESEFASVAVMVWGPAVFSVAVNVPVTFVSIDAAGNTA